MMDPARRPLRMPLAVVARQIAAERGAQIVGPARSAARRLRIIRQEGGLGVFVGGGRGVVVVVVVVVALEAWGSADDSGLCWARV